MTLAELITAAAGSDGVQINIWPTEKGFQANVKRKSDDGWVTYQRPDAAEALTEALSQRIGLTAARIQAERERFEAAKAAPKPSIEDMFA